MFFRKAKDGGPDSTVTGYWLIEWKRFLSVVLLKFDGYSREAYHDHAFNSVSWVLKGELHEQFYDFAQGRVLSPSLKPVVTKRTDFHKVDSVGRTWVLSFRGPWATKWHEYVNGEKITLTDGRRVVRRG